MAAKIDVSHLTIEDFKRPSFQPGFLARLWLTVNGPALTTQPSACAVAELDGLLAHAYCICDYNVKWQYHIITIC